ncbi:MAG: MBL fold metallo-hydrolase [Rhodoblastus sp.]
MRAALRGSLVLAFCSFGLCASLASASEDAKLVVTLLGTGDPIPSPTRNGPAILVQADGLNLMIDAGRGNTVRLRQAGLWPGQIDAVFITHFHSDHLNGLADLVTLGYIGRQNVRRRQPLRIVGPIGMKRIAEALRASIDDDVKIRTADEKIAPRGADMDVQEFAGDGVIFERGGLKVTAFAVDHGVFIKPAFGYRVDYNGMSALFSGDTRFDENLIAHAAGLDLLVHETAVAPKGLQDLDTVKAVLAHHTTPEQAGDVFARTKPRLAAFSHITLIQDEAHPAVSEAEIQLRTREKWNGPLVVGEDMMRISISASEVKIDRPNRR